MFDHDQGTNGTFRLTLEDGDADMFEVTPGEGINEASFSIRVRDSEQLDYERLKVANFTLVAREKGEAPKQSRNEIHQTVD